MKETSSCGSRGFCSYLIQWLAPSRGRACVEALPDALNSSFMVPRGKFVVGYVALSSSRRRVPTL